MPTVRRSHSTVNLWIVTVTLLANDRARGHWPDTSDRSFNCESCGGFKAAPRFAALSAQTPEASGGAEGATGVRCCYPDAALADRIVIAQTYISIWTNHCLYQGKRTNPTPVRMTEGRLPENSGQAHRQASARDVRSAHSFRHGLGGHCSIRHSSSSPFSSFCLAQPYSGPAAAGGTEDLDLNRRFCGDRSRWPQPWS